MNENEGRDGKMQVKKEKWMNVDKKKDRKGEKKDSKQENKVKILKEMIKMKDM